VIGVVKCQLASPMSRTISAALLQSNRRAASYELGTLRTRAPAAAVIVLFMAVIIHGAENDVNLNGAL